MNLEEVTTQLALLGFVELAQGTCYDREGENKLDWWDYKHTLLDITFTTCSDDTSAFNDLNPKHEDWHPHEEAFNTLMEYLNA